jgi:hypothetical protein
LHVFLSGILWQIIKDRSHLFFENLETLAKGYCETFDVEIFGQRESVFHAMR